MKKVTKSLAKIFAALFLILALSLQAQDVFVTDWGSIGRHGWPIIQSGIPGNAGMGGTGSHPAGAWATLRGGFDLAEISVSDVIVVSGKIEFIGGDPDSWSALRYGLFYHDSAGTLQNASTDSARWSGKESDAYGYMFSPRSGVNDQVSGQGGNGTHWVVNGGTWLSTWSGGTMTMGVVNQAPFRAELTQGVYNWAFSVRQLGDGTNEVKWYLIKEDNSYWFGGTTIDTFGVTDKFNGVVFGINNGNDIETTGLTEVQLSDVSVDTGAPIDVPEAPFDPFYVSDWGSIGRHGWPIIPDPDGIIGNAGMGGTGNPPAGAWATLRGGFPESVNYSETDAIKVSGKIEFIGGDPTSWSALRYGFFYHDSAGTLENSGTDSARWSGKESDAFGYMFSPRSGVNDQVSGQGGNGTQWVINGGTWLSTWSGGTMTMGVVNQAPFRAELTEGTYDWAFSVRPLGDGTNEIKWYLIKEDNSYWFGGTAIDTFGVTNKINGVVFGINNGNDIESTGLTEIQLYDVYAEKGSPVEIPPAPFAPFYVADWGSIGRHGWPIIPDPDGIIGNAGMGGTGDAPDGAWATLRGGFPESIQMNDDEAIKVTGKIEFIGGDPNSWSALRYGFFYHDSAGTLENSETDSARWSGKESDAYGYMFSPRSGTNDQVSGQGGNGTHWVVNGGTWLSTWSGGTMTMGVVNQAPFRAELTEGTYDWAFSVRPLGNGRNEIKWYLIKEDNSYWFGGTAIDTFGVINKINGVVFGINNGNDIETTGLTEIQLYDVYVDKGAPIDVPLPPFGPFYVADWGSIGRHGWPIIPDPDGIIGNAGMGGTESHPDGAWATLRGGFETPVAITETEAINVTGKIEFIGGDPNSWSALRYGLFYHDSAGTLQNAGTDSARWSGKESDAYGYMFSPRSGVNDQVGGQGGNGTHWVVNGGTWLSTWSGGTMTMGVVNQAPFRAELTQGTYNWAFSVRPLGNGTNEVKWYLIKEDNSYWFGGTAIDTFAVTEMFNGVVFGINNGNGIEDTDLTEVQLYDVYVDRGDPIDIPIPPFSPFYISEWGIVGDKSGGWTLTRDEVIGNVSIGGDAPPTGWAAVRGGFQGAVYPNEEKALIVEGSMQFVGGGFEAANALRIGLFNMPDAGDLDSTEVGYAWTGSEEGTGYLFLPHSGDNPLTNWTGTGQIGTVGAVADDAWLSTDGENSYVIGSTPQKPAGAVADAGTYSFAFSIQPNGDGKAEVRYYIHNEDYSYNFANILTDNQNGFYELFNSINFAVNTTPSLTRLNLFDVYVDMGDPIVVPDSLTSVESIGDGLPTSFALSQNYPNPFNPSTTIEFAIPKNSEVKIVVYDILGRTVKELVNDMFNPGFYRVNFNASQLASGVYFYRIQAGDYIDVKKLMLMK